jgi:flagellar hook assembly protein FlgD
MNAQLRGYAGWCVPNSSAAQLNNRVGRILGHSKTLMYSIELESHVGVEDQTSVVSLSVASPARSECRMSLTGPAGTEVTVRLYDLSGRLVATVYEGRLPEGGDRAVWDGMDSSGHRAAAGVYFARAEADGEFSSSKVVYIR